MKPFRIHTNIDIHIRHRYSKNIILWIKKVVKSASVKHRAITWLRMLCVTINLKTITLMDTRFHNPWALSSAWERGREKVSSRWWKMRKRVSKQREPNRYLASELKAGIAGVACNCEDAMYFSAFLLYVSRCDEFVFLQQLDSPMQRLRMNQHNVYIDQSNISTAIKMATSATCCHF